MSTAHQPLDETRPSALCRCDPWLDDEKSIRREWEDDAERLLSDDDEVRVKVIDVGRAYRLARSDESLSQSLSLERSETRLILIPQEFSWGSLQISRRCMSILLEYLDSFPAFLEILHTFGQRTWASNESRGHHATQYDEQAGTREQCYLLKCVELHGREGVDDPWSIRQFAVYEKEHLSTKSRDLVIVNPSAPRMLRDKLIALQKARSNLPSRAVMHIMMLRAALANWTAYVNWLESQLYPLTSKAYVAAGPTPSTFTRTPVDMADMQTLQIIQDKLVQANHLLETNKDTAESLARSISSHGSEQERFSISAEAYRVDNAIASFRTESRRVSTLLGKANSVSGLIQNLISTRALETLHDSSKLNASMAKLAQEDNKIMVKISAEGRKDGRTLKTITVLTLAYLPASFVSTLLSMGYINIRGGSLQFKPEMWIFGVLSVTLILGTFGLWFALDLRRNRRNEEANGIQNERSEKSLV